MSNSSSYAVRPASTPGSDEIKTVRLGQFALIDVPRLTSHVSTEVSRAILREWALSPTGVMTRIACPAEGGDEHSAQAIARMGQLVEQWPGTPIGVVCASPWLRHRLEGDPAGQFLRMGPTIPDVWPHMWVEGMAASLTMELLPALRAAEDARSAATRACLDWGLAAMIPRVSPVIGRMVRRSVLEGAGDLHFSLSQHQSRVRIVVEDDVPRPSPDTRGTSPRQRPLAPSGLEHLATRGEFDVGTRHYSWAICEPRGSLCVSSGSSKAVDRP